MKISLIIHKRYCAHSYESVCSTDPKLSTLYSLIQAFDCTPNALLEDVSKMSLDSLLVKALERVQSLDDCDKGAIIKVMDNYCTARKMDEWMKNRSVLGMSFFERENEELNKG